MEIKAVSPSDEKVNEIIQLLSSKLSIITGNNGASSFSNEDMNKERSIFVIAEDNSEIVGCGGLRQINEKVSELKRMYAKYQIGELEVKYYYISKNVLFNLNMMKFGLKQGK
jgi:hypothetical protein